MLFIIRAGGKLENAMKVKMKNSQWEKRHLYFFPISEFNEYEGEEVQVKWLKPDQMALTTGDPNFPFRVLERKYIVSINDSSYSHAQTLARTVKIKGSKGNEYVVTLGNTPHCTCTGFGFRRTCKHITEAQAI